MSETMKGFRCWSSGNLRQTVYSDIGTLPSDADAIFLAAHTPMVISHAKGEQVSAGLAAHSNEWQVLQALLSNIGDSDRNTLIALTGKSGTGKSHVVRWVHAHLRADDRYHLLYVPRAVQTIRELLRRLVEGLPGAGGQELMARIDAAVGNTTPAQLRDRLLEEMRFALNWTLETQAGSDLDDPDRRSAREERNALLGDPDDDGKRRDGLGDLLVLPQVNRALLRPGGLLDVVVQSVLTPASNRDEPNFQHSDLPLREAGIRRELGGNGNLRILWDQITREPGPALRLLDEALRKAMPKTIGLHDHTGETLGVLFQRSRQALRERGQELVLLFEDLAQFGLVDGDLYDQFSNAPGADMAPLRVLFAITDHRYTEFPETVTTRITHHFKVDTFPLENRDVFVARYLNLVRLGRRKVQSAWTEAQKLGTEDWVGNACETREEGLPCRFRDECHAGFGAIEVAGIGNIGLYPYNESALRRSLDGLGAKITPRAVLDVCVTKVLVEADAHIARTTYPHEEVQTLFNFRVSQGKSTLIGDEKGEEAERLYRAMVIWGDEVGLPSTISEAFGLRPDPSAMQSSELEGSVASPRSTVTPPAVTVNEPRTPKQESPLPVVFQWQNGSHLPDKQVDLYRSLLFQFVSSRLAMDQDLYHVFSGKGAELLGELFISYSFNFGADALRGRSAGANRLQFELQRNDDDVRVLIAARWFADHGHWLPEQGDWLWPQGYDPVDLMLRLEIRLDEWAEQVRTIFRKRVGGRALASAAVGTRAVALLALGVAPGALSTVAAVIAQRAVGMPTPSAQWAKVDAAAREVLQRTPAVDLVGDLASVRQGSTGMPQLIDAVELEANLRDVLSAPAEHLRATVKRFTDIEPIVAKAARDLLLVIDGATASFLTEVSTAVDVLADGLDGQPPALVADAAMEVGTRALASHLFRPEHGWAQFEAAAKKLKSVPPDLPIGRRAGRLEASTPDVLTIQHWARWAIEGAAAITVLRDGLAKTRDECLRSEGQIGDLEDLTTVVAQELRQLESHVRALSVARATDG